jgi:hypothetical protein
VGIISLLKPLPIPGRPFYSLIMDFITDLSPDSGYDIILIIIDRFSKRVAFEVERKDDKVEK